ncbi:MAG: hypothetical protein KOO60_01425 [Gemmatimonadales bacterium]|nr:hypothetical protein [Gemmatimonadales bacterium]
MKVVRTLWAMVAVTLAMGAGCNDTTSPEDITDLEDITIQDLAGTWVASSFVYTGVDNPTQQVDLIASGGSFTMTITAAGAFIGTTVYEPMGTLTFTGTMVVSNRTLIQDFADEDIPTLTWTISDFEGDSLTMGGAQGPFDFTDNEIDDLVTASIQATVTRQ